ncbi:MAG: hypothetical protein V1685_01395 [Parcubacteria group bacterium]
MLRNILICVVAVALALTMGGCIADVLGPGWIGSEWVFGDETDYTLTYRLDWLPPAGVEGYERPREFTLAARNGYKVESISEGRYRVRVMRTNIDRGWFREFTITVRARNADERDFYLDEVAGHGATAYHGGVVAYQRTRGGQIDFRIGN